MSTEKTNRQGIKWVKITHTGRNQYTVAFGFNGNLKATRVMFGSKVWSQVASKNWLDDQ